MRSIENWTSLHIKKEAVVKLLRWSWFHGNKSKFSYWMRNWPPVDYPWSAHNERIILLWVSTVFSSPSEMNLWLTDNCQGNLRQEHCDYVNWLRPFQSNNISNREIHHKAINCSLPLIFDCLNRSLLWWNPDATWPSTLESAVDKSRKLFDSWLKYGKFDSNAAQIVRFDIDSDWTWYRHLSESYTYIINAIYKTLLFIDQLTQNNHNINDLPDLYLTAENALSHSVENLLLSNDADLECFDDGDLKTKFYLSRRYLSGVSEVNSVIDREKLWLRHHWNNLPDL